MYITKSGSLMSLVLVCCFSGFVPDRDSGLGFIKGRIMREVRVLQTTERGRV
jgi:hypothetical protein